MDGNQNKTNNVGTIYCPQCGFLNEKANCYCANCGYHLEAMMTNQSAPNQQVTYTQPMPKSKEKNPYLALMIVLGIASCGLVLFMEEAIIFVILLAIASLFSRTTRPYGLTVIITLLVGALIFFIIVVIVLGMCFAGLGGLS